MRFHIRKTNDVRVATVFETNCKALLVIEPSPDINLHIFAVKVKSFKLQAQYKLLRSFQHQMRQGSSVSKWCKHLSHRIVTPPSGLGTTGYFSPAMHSLFHFIPITISLTLDTFCIVHSHVFRVTLKMSLETDRRCPLGKLSGNNKRANQR